MAEIRELFDFGELKIITEKTKLPKYALAKLSFSFAKGDSKNLNNRTYPESLLAREINRKSEELKTAKIAGMLDHPISGLTQLSRSMHAITAMDYDRHTKLATAESYVLDTENGKTFMTLLKSGIKLGASMRGFGNVGADRRVKDDYKLDTVDFVASPSFGTDAQIDATNLIESFNPEVVEEEEKTEKKTKVKINERAVENALKLGYKVRVEECFYEGSFEEFANQNRGILTAEILHQNYPDKFPTIEEALEYLGIPELLEKHQEANKELRVLEYTIAEVYDEARIAGIPPQEMCDKLNEDLKVSTALNNAGITERERFLMSELRDAGFVGTSMELLEKVRKIEQAQKIFKPNLSEAQQLIEIEKQEKKLKEAKRQGIIRMVNRDISAAGGTSQEKLKEMVHQALKEEGLLEE